MDSIDFGNDIVMGKLMVKKGQLFNFSDYSSKYEQPRTYAAAIAAVDFDFIEAQGEWKKFYTPKPVSDREEDRDFNICFLPWLESKGLVKKVHYMEIQSCDWKETDMILFTNEDE